MVRVLITGFEPFRDAPTNPSWDAVSLMAERWRGSAEIIPRLLPVEFEEAPRKLRASIAKHLPDIVIATGVAEGRRGLTPERVAINLDDASIPDNGGYQPLDQPIAEGAPAALWTTLPDKRIVEAMKAHGIPASLSLTAGAYVCNHVFYMLQRELERWGVPSGFIHVPATPEMGLPESVPTVPTATIAEGLRIAVEVTIAHLNGDDAPVTSVAAPTAGPESDEAAATVAAAAAPAVPDVPDVPDVPEGREETDAEATQAFAMPFAEPAPAPVEPEPAPEPEPTPDPAPTASAEPDAGPRLPTWDEIIGGPRGR
ncbi:pyroglutamyl-peptidase I [Demequina pelophila]|uniref:pyroglutamyl-peptidase I n=1 Tax=Demequina pelophila TaxID=1638984 RepID=UPI0007864679|nr:pyroglutamyl-peptidase I [Demequina pelophila]